MSRGLTFWNDERIKLIRDNFIAVSVPTWVAKAEGPEGEFLRGAGIDKRWVTSSGYMHCVSAGGAYLGGSPSEEVLEAFAALPETERTPGGVSVEELNPELAAILNPPKGGLVLKVHGRFLTKENDGSLRNATTSDFPLMADNSRVLESWKLFLQPNTEYMWITADEVQSLIPKDPKAGQKNAVPSAIAIRMARFHLTPKRATTSESGIINAKSVKTAKLELEVVNVSAKEITMAMSGKIHWGSDYDEGKATSPNGPLAMGFETEITGKLTFDRESNKFTRFDIVAPGSVWGRWGDANGKSMYVERPGKSPFGFALELAKGDSPSERIPPGGNSRYVTERGYFDAP